MTKLQKLQDSIDKKQEEYDLLEIDVGLLYTHQNEKYNENSNINIENCPFCSKDDGYDADMTYEDYEEKMDKVDKILAELLHISDMIDFCRNNFHDLSQCPICTKDSYYIQFLDNDSDDSDSEVED
jgi:hypothetical protein